MRHNLTREAFSALSVAEKQQLWETLYFTVCDAPSRYPVHEWRFADLDLWPILKGMMLLRAVRIFHLEDASLMLVEEGNDEARSISGSWDGGSANRSLTRFARSSRRVLGDTEKAIVEDLDKRTRVLAEMPDTPADVVVFSNLMSSFSANGTVFQHLVDPIRLVTDDAGATSMTLLLDADTGDLAGKKLFVGGAQPFKKTFLTIQTAFNLQNSIDFASLPMFREFWSEASRIFPLDFLLSRKIIDNVVQRTLSARRVLYQYLVYGNTRVFVIPAYYGILGWAASAAAKRVERPVGVVDVQHGVAGTVHESYYFPHMASQGFNVLPTDFFCWSDHEARPMAMQANGSYRAHNTGNPWVHVDEVLSGCFSNRLVRRDIVEGMRVSWQPMRASFLEKELEREEDHVLQVLLALQVDSDLDWLEPLLKDPPEGVSIWVRLHPASARDPAKVAAVAERFESKFVDVASASTAPLHELLRRCDLVITGYSSTVLDGIAYGCQPVCYSPAASWYYKSLGDQAPHMVGADAQQIGAFLSQFQDQASERKMSAPTGSAMAALSSAVNDVLAAR